MAVPFESKTHHLLESEAEFEYAGRPGQVLELHGEGYFVLWKGWTNPRTGEVLPIAATTLSYADVGRADRYGKLKVTRRPSYRPLAAPPIPRVYRSEAEMRRYRAKHATVLAAKEAVHEGLKPTRAAFQSKEQALARRAETIILEIDLASSDRKRPRAGASIAVEKRRVFCSDKGRQIHDLYCRWLREGDESLFDNYRACGSADYYTEEERGVVRTTIEERLDQDRPTVSSIHGDVVDAFHAENLDRMSMVEPGAYLRCPGPKFVRKMIDEIAPLEHAVRTRGLGVAHKLLHPFGIGLETTRAMEIVQIDEYSEDLMIFLEPTGILEWLSDVEKELLGLDGTPKRVVFSGAIDVHTHSLVGFKIIPEGTTSALRDTVEMIIQDKRAISAAVGCKDTWRQCGRPEKFILDRGDAYASQPAYDLLAALGVTNHGAPAGKAWIRAAIEAVFKTKHKKFLTRFAGRTFSNVVAKGENDPQKRASLNLATFLALLVRWIVDIYHRTPQRGLSDATPSEAWDKAVAECAPSSMTRRELRLAMGFKASRKPGPRGIRVQNIDYQTDELARIVLAERYKTVDIVWWEHDIGAIEVGLGKDRWITVSAADEKWLGKDYNDYRESMRTDADRAPGYHDIAREAGNDLSAAALKARHLSRLFIPAMTRAEFDAHSDDFRRFMKTADKQFEPEERFGFLAGMDVADAPPPAADPHPSAGRPAGAISDDDLME